MNVLNKEAVSVQGGDHAVLLIHGLSSSPLELRFLARALARDGFTTVAPILEGYSAGSAEQKMEAWVAAAAREFDALAARHKRVSICGLSMGATLSLALAAQRPTAQAVILLSVTLAYDGWAIPWYRFMLDLFYYSPLRARLRYREEEPYGLKNEALRAKIARSMKRDAFSEVGPATISLPALHEAARLANSVRNQVARVSNDCLIIHAIDDETATANNARFVAGRIGSSFLRSIYLDDSYHMIVSDNEREIVTREVGLFLRESEAASLASGHQSAPVVSRALARRLRQMAKLGQRNEA